MDASRFIARKLRFKGKIAMVSVAISSFVMILAVSVSAGYRQEIRRGVSAVSGDIQLTSYTRNYLTDENPISSNPPFLEDIMSVKGVKKIEPAVYRAGIIKNRDEIHGVVFKGTPSYSDTVSLGVSIPQRLSDLMGLEPGSDMLTYFVGEKVKARRFRVSSIYEGILDSEQNLTVYASMRDLQRLNEWDSCQVSAIEVTLDDEFRQAAMIEAKNSEIGTLALLNADEEDEPLVSTSVVDNYSQLFDWLNLIDSNVLLILVLMTVVGGFNMVSGLLILLFRNISTIGILKSMGMTDRAIGKLFLRVSSDLVLKGMAAGNVLALAFCLIQGATHFIKLNPENYFVSYVPVALDVPMILIADVIAYVAIMLLLLLPSMFISKVDPARTVRSA